MDTPETSSPAINAKYDWLSDHNEMVVMYQKESVRAAALLAASFLENEMKKRILDFLVNEESSAKLFEPYHPLSTFSGLVEVTFALGFLLRAMLSDLTLIRKIRNYFAHHPKHVTFEQAPVSDWCRELTTAKGIPTQGGEPCRQDNARDQYLFTIAMVLVYFDRFVGAMVRRIVPEQALSQ